MGKYLSALLLGFLCCTSFLNGMVSGDSSLVFQRIISLNGDDWMIAADSNNTGRQNEWFKNPPVSESRQTRVPWVIQDIFHNYHGVVWYWQEFYTPENPHKAGRCLLKFQAVDYMAEIWVNSIPVGSHEGSETPFEVDITNALVREGKNQVVVRVLNPTYEPIDGISLKDTPSGAKQYPFTSNALYNSGGITGDVSLVVVPSVRITNVFVIPDVNTGKVRIQATILNAGQTDLRSTLSVKVSDAATGLSLASDTYRQLSKPGSQQVELSIAVPDYKLWSPDEPILYRLTASVQTLLSVDENSVRFGFRDFNFKNGYFRLNGKRIFLKGSNFSTHYPIAFTVPLNEDMLRRDVINMKSLGFNFVRIPFGCPNPRILDLFDELGILVQQEHYGCWQIGDYGGYKFPKPDNIDTILMNRFENSITEVIKRDRNHASVVMWGVLNENSDGIIFRKAVSLLSSLRMLDPTRLFVLNSGRFDRVKEIGSMSNPGSDTWDVKENELNDWHPYVWMPYSSATLDLLSGRSAASDQKLYISETGLCFPVDLPSELGDYQQRGKEQSDDAVYFKRQYDKFLSDWKKFDLGSCWARPEDYISDAYKTADALRETAETAIRSNPNVISYTPTNSVADYVMGESVATNFRRLKPQLIGSLLLANSPLRWCLSTEPRSIYSGEPISLSASFSNLDDLQPGAYPATLRVFDPDMKCVFERKVQVNIPRITDSQEPPFAQEILNESILINGSPGKYQLLATLDQGGTAPGGKTEFYISERDSLSQIPCEIVVCGKDSAVNVWLSRYKVKAVDFNKLNLSKREVILISGPVKDTSIFPDLARKMVSGSVVIYLSQSSMGSEKNSTKWLPLVEKGSVESMDAVAGYYRADRWSKHHPFFEGMPSGGMMDYVYFRNLISQNALSQEHTKVAKSGYTYDEVSDPLTYPAETVCGATRISHSYCSGVHLGIWGFGDGLFIVNTLNIKENLGKDPAADRLFYNMLKYASGKIDKPVTALPSDFDQRLTDIGFQK